MNLKKYGLLALVVLVIVVITFSGCLTVSDSEPDPSRKVSFSTVNASNESMSLDFNRTSNGQYYFECFYSSPNLPVGINALLLQIDNSKPITLQGSVDSGRQMGANLIRRTEVVQFLISDDQANQLLNCDDSLTFEFVSQQKINDYCKKRSVSVSQYKSAIIRIKAFINYWNNPS